ncbi:transposase [Kroppenstedtia guangzhouensis]|uniref:Transposase n=1 Tax=Kroppenstedtia guangzhouensis TaxID=1274356 RepID=A0ABQ1H523_9BACL|nr:conjugal transfer protein [Kroppenstedtia guangzhouensis]GGA58041.1 transposase [Kroppenstedtia guangzhouensis]
MKSKWVMVGFYVFLVYTALSTTLAWATRLDLIGGETEAGGKQQQEVAAGEEIPPSAEAFAKNFVKEYLFWTQGSEDSRAQRLDPYLGEGLDAQAGFEFSKELAWDSYTVSRDVWDIQKKKGEYHATVYAETVMTKGKDKKRVDRWVEITFLPAGDSYVMKEAPRLVAPPEASQPEKKEEESMDSAPSEVQRSIEGFLQIFFKHYTTGSPEEIGYHFLSQKTDPGLTGILGLTEIREVQVFETDQKDTYRVDCQVDFQDLASGGKIQAPYTLYLVNRQGRWMVVNLER